jgi:hypothetical protein
MARRPFEVREQCLYLPPYRGDAPFHHTRATGCKHRTGSGSPTETGVIVQVKRVVFKGPFSRSEDKGFFRFVDTTYIAVIFSPITWLPLPQTVEFLNCYVGAGRPKGVLLCRVGFCCGRSALQLPPSHARQLTAKTKNRLWSFSVT